MSLSRLRLVALTSQSRLETITPMTRSRLGLETLTSRSRLVYNSAFAGIVHAWAAKSHNVLTCI